MYFYRMYMSAAVLMYILYSITEHSMCDTPIQVNSMQYAKHPYIVEYSFIHRTNIITRLRHIRCNTRITRLGAWCITHIINYRCNGRIGSWVDSCEEFS